MPDPRNLISNDLWRSAKVFNLFRALMAIALVVVSWWLQSRLFPDVADRLALNWLSASYLMLAAIYALCLRGRWPSFRLLLTVQVAGDIAFIVGVMHVAGGMKTGVGLMLLPYLAGAGLISRGRATLFHAALASIALLLQQGLQFASSDNGSADFFQAAMLSIACFATAWLAHRLARYATESERLAERRGSELANMAQINRLVIQDVSDGVLVLDEAGVVRQFNQQAERLLGFGMIAGKTRLADFNPLLAGALSNWKAGYSLLPVDLEVTRQAVRPRFMPVQVGASASGTVVFLEDIERLRREAQQLKLAALGRLTANIAHEIRNPLSAIGHAAQLLAEEAVDPASLRLTRIMVENSRRLDKIVRAVLDLNRRDRAEPVDLRLHDWLNGFVAEFREVEGIAATIHVECPQGAIARFDEGQLHQVLWNLCRNGWRYSDRQDRALGLAVVRLDDAWALDVHDNGPGIAPDDIAKLFEPFFTTEAKGTGLGLFIAREICAGNDSVLEYVAAPSHAKQTGACFRIIFPARPT
ncbi:PAS domain-containing protein [Chitinimonas arctica]|uniref:histidine kinase n=1 Tax=Chitinimonas arctica TaxID=2594795 RepID=A0A516SGK6_9NEIS|nr:ATP-binding protein [Chitinimonas arctica]QDQ27294.1 PAS domain-containing protein [Chitinimonas arctica]